jgi:tRNA(Ile2)-agmatinylcytidine synthase
MRCFVGIDDTDSSRGFCTTYLAYRIACDLKDILRVLPYPRLVRLNPNIPFKTRGNAAVCLEVETGDPDLALGRLTEKLEELSDVRGGANSGLVFLKEPGDSRRFVPLYEDALAGVVSALRVRRVLDGMRVAYRTLGNGMGLVGAASSLAFDRSSDHTYELIAYRRRESWGTPRLLDSSSVRSMDQATFPRTFNSYDYQKRKPLVAPHGPDPVFVGIRGESPAAVLEAFHMLKIGEELQGHMVYMSNQHTDAHLRRPLDWKVFSSGWFEGRVERLSTGPGGHVYADVNEKRVSRACAFYEPTGDLRRVARRLGHGDRVRLFGGVRRGTSRHPKILNVEKMEVVSLGPGGSKRGVVAGTYISSPRANRHLTKPLARYGREIAGESPADAPDWLSGLAISRRVPVRSR